jgi:hypothetical protein
MQVNAVEAGGNPAIEKRMQALAHLPDDLQDDALARHAPARLIHVRQRPRGRILP